MSMIDICNEIIAIANRLDKSINAQTTKKHVSSHGNTDAFEFFTELHASCRCRNDNILCKALEIWLERWNKNMEHKNEPFFLKNKDWYTYDYDKCRYVIKDTAPEKVKENYKRFYKELDDNIHL